MPSEAIRVQSSDHAKSLGFKAMRFRSFSCLDISAGTSDLDELLVKKSIPQGLKPNSVAACNVRAEALTYLEAKTKATANTNADSLRE
jgi:hypothetical protein